VPESGRQLSREPLLVDVAAPRSFPKSLYTRDPDDFAGLSDLIDVVGI
jgi:hypothetical protein